MTSRVVNLENSINENDLAFLHAHGIRLDGNIQVSFYSPVPSQSQVIFGAFMSTIGQVAYGILMVIFMIFMGFYMKSNMHMMNGLFKKKFQRSHGQSVRFEDVAGMRGPKEEVVEIIHYLRNPKAFAKLGARVPRGVLMYGAPGNGKTLLAKAVAGEAGVPFLEQNASSFVQMFVGMGANSIRDIFREARRLARRYGGCVVFIDEIDAVAMHRDGPSTHDERLQTVNALLAEMDGFGDNTGVVIMAATNRLESLDPALLRPGRFDRKVFVPLPGPEARIEILARYIDKLPACRVDPSRLSSLSQGMSGADLANWVNEAAIEASREGAESVLLGHFERSRDRILVGPKNHGVILNPLDRDAVAWHEAGHAIVRLAMGGKVNKVSIIPRGAALGVTLSEADETSVQFSREDLSRELTVLMAGRAAEQCFAQHVTAGAANDIERASRLAFEAVTMMGFGGHGVFVPQTELGRSRAEKSAAHLVQTALDTAIALLRANHSVVEQVQARLVDGEDLEGPELQALWSRHHATHSQHDAVPA